MRPLDRLPSLKLKLGVVIVAAVVVTLTVNEIGLRIGLGAVARGAVAALLALGMVQLLAHGMTLPLRQMATAAQAMARGDTAARVETSSRDEVGELAAAFNAMAAELAQLDRMRRDLVANVSHELRTPIGALQALLENIVDGIEPADPDVMRTMSRQVERLGRLVTQLLDLSRLESGAIPFEPAVFDVAALVEDVAAESRLAGGAVDIVVAARPGLQALGDAERIHQVLANLVENANRYAPPGSPVTISAEGQPFGGVVLAVTDEGPGIAAADASRVFERFYRADSSRASGSGGAGLGLAIARWIVDLHGGTIHAERRQPTGCRMVVTLPPAGPPGAPAAAVTQERRETAAPAGPPSPPFEAAPWADLTLARPPERWVLPVVVVIAVLTDVATRAGGAAVTGSALVVAVAAALLASGRLASVHSRVLVAGAVVFSPFLALRMSPWLLPLDVVASGGLLVLGVALSRSGSAVDLTVPGAVARAAHVLAHGLAAPGFVAAAVPSPTTRPPEPVAPAVVRGLFLAVPVVAVTGVLLASADAVFRSFFDITDDPANIAAHVALLLVGGWGVAGLLRAASAVPLDLAALPRPRRPLRPAEALTVLLCIDALYAAFAIAQLVALGGSGRRVLHTAGMTYAEYARSGFFQLLAVAAFTLVVLLTLRATTDLSAARSHRRFVILAEVAVALTMMIVIVAVHRLLLYEHVFGLTMLRLFSTVFACWIAVVFLLFAATLLGVGTRRAWFLPAVMLTGLMTLLGLNVVNPERYVVNHDVTFAVSHPARLDPTYLTNLSDDAVPALAAAVPRVPSDMRTVIVTEVCRPQRRPFRGWAAANASRAAADRARTHLCGSSG